MGGTDNRRASQANGINRPDSDYISTQQVEHCSSSADVAFTITVDASKPVDVELVELQLVANSETDEWVDDDDDDDDDDDVRAWQAKGTDKLDTHQAGNICAIGRSTMTNNRGRNARKYGRRRFVHGKRGQLSTRQPLSQQSDPVSYENSGSTLFESRMELVLNVEADEWVDVDDDNDDDNDAHVSKARSLPFPSRGKQKNWKVRACGVRSNRRSRSRADRSCDALGCENMLISREIADTDYITHSKPIGASVRQGVTKHRSSPACSKSGRRQKNFTHVAASARSC